MGKQNGTEKLEIRAYRKAQRGTRDGRSYYQLKDMSTAASVPGASGWYTQAEVTELVGKLAKLPAKKRAKKAEQARKVEEARRTIQTIEDLLSGFVGTEIDSNGCALDAGTQRNYRQDARNLVKRLGSTPLRSLVSPVLAGAKSASREQRIPTVLREDRNSVLDADSFARLTLNRQYVTLKGAWNWAQARGFIPLALGVLHVPRLSGATKEKATPTRDQWKKMRAELLRRRHHDGIPKAKRLPRSEQIPAWAVDGLLILAGSGIRIGALARLKVKEINVAESTASYYFKTRRSEPKLRVPAFTPEALEILKWMIEERSPEDRVFSQTDATMKVKLGEYLGRVAEATGYPKNISPHALRRYVECEMIDGGASIHVVAEQMGHSPEQALKSYLQARPGAKLRALAHLIDTADETPTTPTDRRGALRLVG